MAQFCCRVTTTDVDENKKILVERHLTDTADVFIKRVSCSSFFLGREGLDCLIFRDNTVSIRLPGSMMPFVSFPNVCVPLNSNDQNLWKARGFFSLVPVNSKLSESISIIFEHQIHLLPDITVEAPIKIDSSSTIRSIFESANGLLRDYAKADLDALFIDPDNIEFVIENQFSKNIYDGNTVGTSLFSDILDNNDVYITSLKFYYRLRPSSYPKSDPLLNQLIESIFKAKSLNHFFDLLIEKLIEYIKEYPDLSIKKTIGSVFNAVSNYFLPYVKYLSNNSDATYEDWATFIELIDPQKIRLDTNNSLITSYIFKWHDFITTLVEMTFKFTKFFSQEQVIQNKTLFGPAVFASKMISGRFSILMTRGFIYFVNFEPEIGDKYLFLPNECSFNVKDVSILPVLSAISIGSTNFIPYEDIGIFLHTKPFSISFDDKSFTRTFWISYLLSRSCIKRNIFNSSLAPNETRFKISYPMNKEIFASVKLLDYEFNVRFPYSKLFSSIAQLQTPEMKRKCQFSFLPSVDVCKRSFKFGVPVPFDFCNDRGIKSIGNDWKIIRSILADAFASVNPALAAKVLAPFRLSDFTYSLSLTNNSLLSLQIRIFKPVLDAILIGQVPLLHYSCLYSQNPVMISQLLEVFDVNMPDSTMNTPIFYAMKSSSLVPAKVLISAKANLDAINSFNETPLILCFNTSQYDKAEFLLQNGASVNKVDDPKAPTPIMFACDTKDAKAFQLLGTFSNKSINAPTNKGMFLTHATIDCGFTKYLKYVRNLDPNMFSSTYPHPLHYILARPFNRETIDDLLSLPNIKLNMVNQEGDTPLLAASKLKDLRFFARLCIDERCDVNFVNDEGMCALGYIAMKGSVENIRALLEAGALIDMPNSIGETPLFLALKENMKENAEFLLEKGASTTLWCLNDKEMAPSRRKPTNFH